MSSSQRIELPSSMPASTEFGRGTRTELGASLRALSRFLDRVQAVPTPALLAAAAECDDALGPVQQDESEPPRVPKREAFRTARRSPRAKRGSR